MKKNLSVFLFLFISLFANAQSLVLTQAANEPSVGDVDPNFPLDTSAFAGSMPVSMTGSNSVWDFTQLYTNTSPFNTNYVSPSSYTEAASFPGCTIVQNDNVVNTFIKSSTTPTTQTEVLGITSSTMSLIFSNSAIIAKYPISFGSSSTDNLSGTFAAFTYSGTCTGNIVTKADGTGTLMLPDGITLTNVLRVKSVQTVTFNIGFFPFASGKQTVYNYYHASKKFAVLSINYNSLALTASSPTVSAYVAGNEDLFFNAVGIKNYNLNNSNLTVFPNPFSNQLNLEISQVFQPSEIRIYKMTGELIKRQSYSESINTIFLESGIYFIEVQTSQGILRKKIIKQ